MNIKIFIEGGGERKDVRSDLREGFRTFINKLDLEDTFQPIACGTRSQAWRDFLRESRDESKSYVLLLVDSESEVAANSNSWDHVQKQDGWPKPGYAGEDQLHLMAQAMESWLLGDLDNLAAFFESKLHLNEQRHFRRECIKLDSPLEKVPKNMILDWLRKATEAEGRTPYHKTAHGFHILQYLDPEKVRAQLPHADRFCAALIKISQFRFPKTSTS